jgi:hypothetical protein
MPSNRMRPAVIGSSRRMQRVSGLLSERDAAFGDYRERDKDDKG